MIRRFLRNTPIRILRDIRLCSMISAGLNFTSLRFHRLDDMIESIGLPRECLCTYCWDGKE